MLLLLLSWVLSMELLRIASTTARGNEACRDTPPRPLPPCCPQSNSGTDSGSADLTFLLWINCFRSKEMVFNFVWLNAPILGVGYIDLAAVRPGSFAHFYFSLFHWQKPPEKQNIQHTGEYSDEVISWGIWKVNAHRIFVVVCTDFCKRKEHGSNFILSYDNSYFLVLPALHHLISAESFSMRFPLCNFVFGKNLCQLYHQH